MNTEIVVQNQLTLMNECYQCQQLNELCSDCLEAKEARDAVIAHKLVDEYEPMYLNMATIIQRCLTNNTSSTENGFNISEEEKAQLLNDINKLGENLNSKDNG